LTLGGVARQCWPAHIAGYGGRICHLFQKKENERVIIDDIQVLLEEKRTSLSVMRTGIAIFVVQIFIFGFLIATSKFYHFLEVMHMSIPFYIINACLMLLAYYLIVTSLIRIRRSDRSITELKRKHRRIAGFMD
jgi:nitrogen fixation/metabolism regulation signal transduction histidine kinase